MTGAAAPVGAGVLVLAPRGRDAQVIGGLLQRAGAAFTICATMADLVARLGDSAAAAVLTEESLLDEALPALLAWVERQPPWSDMPFVTLATRQAGPRPAAWAATLARLGNVVLLERPLNAETLDSSVRSALRARRRQFQVREHVAEREADARALRARDERLLELNEQLEERVAVAVAERGQALEQLAQAQRLQALGQLAGGIAHDINNVLQAVTAGVQLVAQRAADPEAVRMLAAKMGEAAERGSSVARRMLAFARQDELRAEPVDVSATLSNLQEMLTHSLGGAVVVRLGDMPDGASTVLADKGQLDTVLINLAANARDAMPNGGSLKLSAEPAGAPPGSNLPEGAYVRLLVSDDGVGMDAATLARASEPFFTTKPVGKGTGLGLAMAQGFAAQSGGALRIDSAPGRGTTVSLWLPAAGQPQSAAAAGSAPVVAGSGRVMLVDDDALVREMLVATLQARGFDVVAAASAQDGLARLDEGAAPDILVSDLSMPGMDGATFLREAQRRRPGLPAILLTGYAGDGSVAPPGLAEAWSRGAPGAGELSDGAFDVLRKPVGGAQLCARIAASLRRGAPAPAAASQKR